MTSFQLLSMLLYGVGALLIIRRLPLPPLLQQRHRAAAFINSFALLLLMWLFRVRTDIGPDIHFLLMTALTLTLGFRGAVTCASLALLILTLTGQQSWALLGVNGLAMVLIPAVITYSVYALTFHHVTRHFIVYIFACAFLPAALTIALQMGLTAGYLIVDDIYPIHQIIDNYLLIIPLLLFPEALLNGVAMTLLVIYKPEWVYTFADKHYFDPKS